ncbi:MAG: hypothetical protein NC204_05950 [Candidatus Amulumruptor caecigallinarius]|nr:hypothetical protein [Candidatus Amulumruptor caecigallinarius]
MAFSSWKIFCHPRVARSAMEELEQQLLQLEKKFEETEKRDKERISILEEENSSLSWENSELCLSREKQSGTIKSLQREIAERASIDEQLRSFETMLKGVEDMKRRYEARISRLRACIKEMRSERQSPDCTDDELGLIDMSANPANGVGCDRQRRPDNAGRREEADDSDWMESLQL